jgi:hypothetical protein
MAGTSLRTAEGCILRAVDAWIPTVQIFVVKPQFYRAFGIANRTIEDNTEENVKQTINAPQPHGQCLFGFNFC